MPEKKIPSQVTFTYEISTDFTARYADGATAKSTPSGNIYVGFFLERPHEFEKVIHEVTPEGNLGKEVSRTAKEGICRQLQTAVVMNPAAAKAICKLVMDTLDKMESSKVQIELPKKENPHGR